MVGVAPAGVGSQLLPGPARVKILIAGGFGVGKTTMVQAVSEIRAVSTEVRLTHPGARVDDTGLVPGKAATTVAMDFGRISLGNDLVLHLFGTPGQARFWFMWDRLARGALGAVVLVDVRRLVDSFAPIDYFEQHRVPFAVCVNQFDHAPVYPAEQVREALAVDVPVLSCDARHREGAKRVLIALVEHITHTLRRAPGDGPAPPQTQPRFPTTSLFGG